MSRMKARMEFADPTRGPVVTPRFIASIVLVALGIAWMTYFYVAVRAEFPEEPGKPAFMADLGEWNYVIGFGLFFLGLAMAAHPSTPLGRGRGVVVGMLGCFVIGLIWICVYYVFSNDISRVPLFNDLGQYNLIVGIGFMAVGFSFATRWE